VSSPVTIAFGVYQLDLAHEELRRLGTPLRMQPQPFKLLVFLASRAGEIVSREDIEKEIWGEDTFVDFERGLNHCVRQVRAVLGDDATAPRYIETVPRRGYRFIAPAKFVDAADPSAAATAETADSQPGPARPEWRRNRLWIAAVGAAAALVAATCMVLSVRYFRQAAQTPSAKRVMLAVLPFDNLTGDPSQGFVCDGVTDETIVHLSQLSPAKLGVIARTSAVSFKNSGKPLDRIGRELGADYFLEGTVKRDGTKVRIAAELVRAQDQSQLWAESYEGEMSDSGMLVFEESVASRISLSLSLMLPESRTPSPGTSNPLAYEAYLRGRYEWNKRNDTSFQKASDYFRQAIAYDPAYAQAYAGLADCYDLTLEYYERQSPETFAILAKSAAETAVKLNPQLSESHASLAFNLWRYQARFSDAEAEFRKALELNPNNATAHHWYGMYLASRGRFDEGKEELRSARMLDPLSLIIVTNAGWVDYFARDYDGAIVNYQDALKLDPTFQTALMKLAWAYEQKGMWQQAASAREQFYEVAGHPEIAHEVAGSYAAHGYSSVIQLVIAETQKPDAKPFYDDYEIAKLYAFAGDFDEAVLFLKRAQSRHSGWLVYLAVEPAFDKLRNDQRYARLISETVSGSAH